MLLRDHFLYGRPARKTLKLARLVIETLQRAEFFVLAKLCLLHGGFQNPDRFVIHLERHRVRVSVLAAMREREARRDR